MYGYDGKFSKNMPTPSTTAPTMTTQPWSSTTTGNQWTGQATSAMPVTLIPSNQLTTSQEVLASIYDFFAQQSANQGASQPTPAAVINQDNGQTTFSEVVLVIGGTTIICHFLDKVVKNIYYQACYESDERVVALVPGFEPGFRSQAWDWIAKTLRKFWMPLWFSHQKIRDRAVREHMDNAFVDQRIQRLQGAIAQNRPDHLANQIPPGAAAPPAPVNRIQPPIASGYPGLPPRRRADGMANRLFVPIQDPLRFQNWDDGDDGGYLIPRSHRAAERVDNDTATVSP